MRPHLFLTTAVASGVVVLVTVGCGDVTVGEAPGVDAGPHDDFATSMVVDGCGRAFVGGYTKGALVPGSLGTAGYDMFVVRAEL